MAAAIFNTMPCFSGYRRDCTIKSCRFRHIDDVTTNKKRKMDEPKMEEPKYCTRSSTSQKQKDSPTKETKAEQHKGNILMQINSASISKLNSLQPVKGGEQYNKTGLKNLTNTCFMNAVLQCLVNTEALAKLLSTIFTEEESSNRQQNVQTTGGLSRELLLLIAAMKSGCYHSISPTDFRKELVKIAPEYLANRQEDAHEVLTTILCQIEEEVAEKSSPENGNIDKIFNGTYTTRTECKACGQKSKQKDPLRYLQLELPKHRGETTLHKCISSYTEKQLLTDKKCPECWKRGKRNEEAYQTNTITKGPEVLVIQLKRFIWSKDGRWQQKKDNLVSYPLMLDMGPHTTENENNEYELYSVVNHYGGISSGHYTALCRDATDTKSWYKYDDQRTSQKIKENELSQKAAYLLFYKKRNGTEPKGKKPPMDETIVKEDAINDQEEESDADDDEPTQTKQHRVTESNPTLATDDPIEELTKDISSDEEIDEISLSPVDVPCTEPKTNGILGEVHTSHKEGEEEKIEHKEAAIDEGKVEITKEKTLRKSERKGAKSKKAIEVEAGQEEKNKEVKPKKKVSDTESQLAKGEEASTDEVLYCSCRRPYDYSKHECMLKCDLCVEWYHCECVDFICKKCSTDGKDHITEKPRSNSRKMPNSKEMDQKREEINHLKNTAKELKAKHEDEMMKMREKFEEAKKQSEHQKKSQREKDNEIKELGKKLKKLEKDEEKDRKQQVTKENKEMKILQTKNKETEEKVANLETEIGNLEKDTGEQKKRIKILEKQKTEAQEKLADTQATLDRVEQENSALKIIEKEIKNLREKEPENGTEIEGQNEEQSVNAVISLCEAKQLEIAERIKQLEKIEKENKKLEKANKENKECIKKYETKQQELITDSEQLIKEKCSITKQSLILEENNRTLRSIVKYLELEDVAAKSEAPDPEGKNKAPKQTNPEDLSSKKKTSKGDGKKDADRNPSKTKPCWHFENRTCSYGEECRYQHRKEQQRIKNNEKNDDGREKKKERKEAKREYCWYDENTRCSYGNECKNEHRKRADDRQKRHQNTGPRNRTKEASDPCWYFENTNCIFGERCRYKHGDKENEKKFEQHSQEEREESDEEQERADENKEDEDEENSNKAFLENRVTQGKENLYREVLLSPWV